MNVCLWYFDCFLDCYGVTFRPHTLPMLKMFYNLVFILWVYNNTNNFKRTSIVFLVQCLQSHSKDCVNEEKKTWPSLIKTGILGPVTLPVTDCQCFLQIHVFTSNISQQSSESLLSVPCRSGSRLFRRHCFCQPSFNFCGRVRTLKMIKTRG